MIKARRVLTTLGGPFSFLLQHRVDSHMAKGWIVNVSRSDGTLEVDRDQEPVCYANGLPVFEIWFWHADLRCYFVMTKGPLEDAMSTIFFHPDSPPEHLQESIAQLQSAAVKMV